jgi:hypothetical protein
VSDYRFEVTQESRWRWTVLIFRRTTMENPPPGYEFVFMDSVRGCSRARALRQAEEKVARRENPPPKEIIDLTTQGEIIPRR